MCRGIEGFLVNYLCPGSWHVWFVETRRGMTCVFIIFIYYLFLINIVYLCWAPGSWHAWCEMCVRYFVVMNAVQDVITDWRILSLSDLLRLDYYQYEPWISTFPHPVIIRVITGQTMITLKMRTNWVMSIWNKGLTRVLLSRLREVYR